MTAPADPARIDKPTADARTAYRTAAGLVLELCDDRQYVATARLEELAAALYRAGETAVSA